MSDSFYLGTMIERRFEVAKFKLNELIKANRKKIKTNTKPLWIYEFKHLEPWLHLDFSCDFLIGK